MYNYLKKPNRNLLYTLAVPPAYSPANEAERAAAVAESAALDAERAAEIGAVEDVQAARKKVEAARNAILAVAQTITQRNLGRRHRPREMITPEIERLLVANFRSNAAERTVLKALERAERVARARETLSEHLLPDIISTTILPYMS